MVIRFNMESWAGRVCVESVSWNRNDLTHLTVKQVSIGMKTFVYIGTSLDGYIARKDGDMDWLVKYEDHEVHDSYREFSSRIDAIVIGRGTFKKVLTYPLWP